MSDLTNLAPASTFGSLLNTATTSGLTAVLQAIQDGFGHPSPLSLSTDSMDINRGMGGSFSLDTIPLTANAANIDSVCVLGSFDFLKTALTIPKGTTAERPAGSSGDFRFNTETLQYEGYDNGWFDFETLDPSLYYGPDKPTFIEDTFSDGTFNLSVGNPIANFNGGRVESTIFGDESLQTAGTGSNLVGIGYQCLKLLTTANNVTGSGHLCLSSLTIGTYSTAFGKSSQQFNMSGICNVSMGAFSLSSLVDADSNTAIGHQSLLSCLDSLNTASGFQSGSRLENGQRNSFFGEGSGLNVEDASNSCFLGSQTGGVTRIYNGCTFVGQGASAIAGGSTLTNACAIGFGAVVEVNDAIILGDSTVPTKVGIGTNAPENILHVANGDGVFEGKLGAGTTAPSTRFHVKDGVSYFQNSNVGIGFSNPTLPLEVSGDSYFNGKIGIGILSPTLPLHVVGDSYFNGNIGVKVGVPLVPLHVVGNSYFNGSVGVGISSPLSPLHVVGNSYFNGNVGVGINSPSLPLHVVGNSYFNGKIGIGVSSPVNSLHVIGDVQLKDNLTPLAAGNGGGIYRRQFNGSGTVVNIPIIISGADTNHQFQVIITASVIIATTASANYAYISSVAAYRWNGTFMSSVGTLPTISFTGKNTGLTTLTSAWQAGGSNANLNFDNSVDGRNINVLVSVEYFFQYLDI